MKTKEKFVIGIDIGAQSAKCGIVDRDGGVLGRCTVVTNEDTDPEAFISKLADALHALVKGCNVEKNIVGIGVGAPNANPFDGTISNAANLTWAKDRTVEFSRLLSEKTGGIKVSLTNDANAAAMGEMTYGAAKGMKNFIEITMGTGVGSGIVIDGSLVLGADGFAGELGHTLAISDGRQCGCGKKGCLEAYCSAIGAARTAKEWLANTDEPSLLRSLPEITSKDIYDAAMQGDALAARVFDYTGTILGRKLSDFIAFSAPEAIILFGGMTKAGKLLYDPVFKAMNENVMNVWKGKVKLLFSSLKESDAAVLGASALAWK